MAWQIGDRVWERALDRGKAKAAPDAMGHGAASVGRVGMLIERRHALPT